MFSLMGRETDKQAKKDFNSRTWIKQWTFSAVENSDSSKKKKKKIYKIKIISYTEKVVEHQKSWKRQRIIAFFYEGDIFKRKGFILCKGNTIKLVLTQKMSSKKKREQIFLEWLWSQL